MGGSTDAFALYLSLFKVERPTDTSKQSTSLSFHKEAENKFEYGTATLKKNEESEPQKELMTHEEMKARLDEETKKTNLPTEHIQANPTARNGQRLGGEEETRTEELTLGQRRQMAVRAAEKRMVEKEGLQAGEVSEVPIRAQPAA
jgi:hypothetical protein